MYRYGIEGDYVGPDQCPSMLMLMLHCKLLKPLSRLTTALYR